MSEFAGKVVLVTGAGLGPGRALAEAFAAQGARVVVNDLTPINLDETVARIQAAGGQAQPIVADIASKLALQTMLHQILDVYGRLDILLNCAGVNPPDELLKMDEWDWRRALDINLTGPFLLMQSVARMMRDQGGGSIVNWVSLRGDSAAAAAGKAGLLGLTDLAAHQLGAYNIRINAVCSGVSGTVPRPDLPEDLLELVLFLCRPAAERITGQTIPTRF